MSQLRLDNPGSPLAQKILDEVKNHAHNADPGGNPPCGYSLNNLLSFVVVDRVSWSQWWYDTNSELRDSWTAKLWNGGSRAGSAGRWEDARGPAVGWQLEIGRGKSLWDGKAAE
jgi:hypothetical protein